MDATRRPRYGRALLTTALVAAATAGLLPAGGGAGRAATTTTGTTTGTTGSPPSTTHPTVTTTARTTGSSTPPAATPPNLALTFEDGTTGGLLAASGVTIANSTQTPYSGARDLRIDRYGGYGELVRLPLGDLDPHRDWRLDVLLRGGTARTAVTWDVVVGGQVAYRVPGWVYPGWSSTNATIPAWSVPSGPAELVLSTYRCPTDGAVAPTPVLLDDLQVRQADAASPRPSVPPPPLAEPQCTRSTSGLETLSPGTTVASWDFEDGTTGGWTIGDPAHVGAMLSATTVRGHRALLVSGLTVADADRGPGVRRQPTGTLPVGDYRFSAKALLVSGGGPTPGLEGVVDVPGSSHVTSTGISTPINRRTWTPVDVVVRFDDNATWSAALQVWNRGFCLPGGTTPVTFALDDVTLVYEGGPTASVPVAPGCPATTAPTTWRTTAPSR